MHQIATVNSPLLLLGKLLSDDIVDTKAATCPNEYINIRFKKNGSSTEEVLPMYRGKYLTRTGSSTNAPRIMVHFFSMT